MSEISIIIPAYKAEKYLARCIDSILAQSVSDIELILVDDGSPDSSGKICDEYAEKDSRVKAVHKKNGGVSSARNAGLEVATGKYIMFCDSDDTVRTDWCEKLLCVIRASQEDVLGCCAVCLQYSDYEKVELIGEENAIHLCFNPEDSKLFKKIYDTGCFLAVYNKIYSRSLIESGKIKFREDINNSEDIIFNIEYLNYTGKFAYIDAACYNYQLTDEESATRRNNPDFFKVASRVMDIMLPITKNNPYGKVIEDWFYSYSKFLCERSLICVTDAPEGMLSKKECRKRCKEILRSGYYAEALKRTVGGVDGRIYRFAAKTGSISFYRRIIKLRSGIRRPLGLLKRKLLAILKHAG